jgi:hypothetical protein
MAVRCADHQVPRESNLRAHWHVLEPDGNLVPGDACGLENHLAGRAAGPTPHPEWRSKRETQDLGGPHHGLGSRRDARVADRGPSAQIANQAVAQ